MGLKRDEIDGKLKTLYNKYQGQLYKSPTVGETRTRVQYFDTVTFRAL
jgi:hypothetical protein